MERKKDPLLATLVGDQSSRICRGKQSIELVTSKAQNSILSLLFVVCGSAQRGTVCRFTAFDDATSNSASSCSCYTSEDTNSRPQSRLMRSFSLNEKNQKNKRVRDPRLDPYRQGGCCHLEAASWLLDHL